MVSIADGKILHKFQTELHAYALRCAFQAFRVASDIKSLILTCIKKKTVIPSNDSLNLLIQKYGT